MARRKFVPMMDRRRFLMGAGGAGLLLPMLREFAPRHARGAEGDAPKRLLVVSHHHGRLTGTSDLANEDWSPSSSSGPLPETISPLLASLASIRDRIVTIDGVDDLVRHMSGDADGHRTSNITALTCVAPGPGVTPAAPSFDYAAGMLLRASESQRPSIIFPSSPAVAEQYLGYPYYGAGGTPGYAVSSSPLESLVEVFGPPEPSGPPPVKTLRDRLVGRRKSILDSVAGEYTSLASRVSAEDRVQLEQHAEFIRTLETHLDGSLTADCMRPMESAIPPYNVQDSPGGELDATITPWQIENLVMSLACDATRVGVLHFYQTAANARFPSAFGGNSPIPLYALHEMIHDNRFPQSEGAAILRQGFGEVGTLFTHLVQRLSEVVDVDGRTLLDNTLVLWTSELGYGSHHSHNIPVILAGMPEVFTGGQGRHIVLDQPRTTGDLFTTILDKLGVQDTVFGQQGKISDAGQPDIFEWAGRPGFIHGDRPLHTGFIEV